MAAEKGAEGVFIISRKKSDYKKYLKARDYYDPKPNISYPLNDEDTLKHRNAFAAYMNVKTASRLVNTRPKELVAALEEMEATRTTAAGRFSGQVAIDASSDCIALPTANVIGIIEGTDLKNEAVVVVAHYDHLGMDNTGIYLRRRRQCFRHRCRDGNCRSLLACSAGGDPSAAHGDFHGRIRRRAWPLRIKYYSQYPVVSLDSTYACVNIDMIGRASTKLASSPDYISGYVYNSTDLLEISQQSNSLSAPDLEDRVEFRKNLRGGSDHYYFAKHGIPSLFYFTGFHPDYHEITDTPDKILYDRMEKIVRAIFVTTWELANREERLVSEE
jgi:hypothetical protein